MTRNHVDSFNFIVDGGLDKAVATLEPIYLTAGASAYRMSIVKATLEMPAAPNFSRKATMYPSECRQARTSYRGKLSLVYQIKCVVCAAAAGRGVRKQRLAAGQVHTHTHTLVDHAPVNHVSAFVFDGRSAATIKQSPSSPHLAHPFAITPRNTTDGKVRQEVVSGGAVPIMVMSKLCNLSSKTPKQLVADCKEEARVRHDCGGRGVLP